MHISRVLSIGLGLVLLGGGAGPYALAQEAATPENSAIQKTIPEAFWGRWDYDGKLCRGDFDSWITISAQGVDSGEDSNEVISVERLGPTAIRVTSDDYGEMTSDSTEGDAYAGRSKILYVLNDKGRKLAFRTTELRSPTHEKVNFVSMVITAEKCPELSQEILDATDSPSSE